MTVRVGLVAAVAAFLAACVSAALAASGPTTGEVYRVWLDGRQLDLTGNAADDRNPVLSPDGKRLAFVSDRGQRPGDPLFGVHVYVVGSDGRGLERVSGYLSGRLSFDREIAWAPDSKRLVVAAASVPGPSANGESLFLIEPGRKQRLILRASILWPTWSPDGRLITFHTGDGRHYEIRAVTPEGRTAFLVRGENYSWSPAGLLAVGLASPGHKVADVVRIYSRRGRLRAGFPGRSFAWSPDGNRLASIASDRIEIRALSGHVLLRRRVPGLHHGQANGLVWTSNSHLLIGGTGGPLSLSWIGVDAATGQVSTGGKPYAGPLSPDTTHIVYFRYNGRNAALAVSHRDGSGARMLIRLKPCPDPIETDVQWLPDNRSVIYELKCQSTVNRP